MPNFKISEMNKAELVDLGIRYASILNCLGAKVNSNDYDDEYDSLTLKEIFEKEIKDPQKFIENFKAILTRLITFVEPNEPYLREAKINYFIKVINDYDAHKWYDTFIELEDAIYYKFINPKHLLGSFFNKCRVYRLDFDIMNIEL